MKWTTGSRAGAVIAVLTLAGGLGLFSGRAAAVIADVVTVQQPGYLSVTTDLPRNEFIDLSPGEPVYWQIGADLTDGLSGSLVLEMRKSGRLATSVDGLVVDIERCSEPWLNLDTLPTCGYERAPVLMATPGDDYRFNSPVVDLLGIPSANGKYLLVALSLNIPPDETGRSVMGLSGSVGIGLTAAGDELPGDSGIDGGSGTPGAPGPDGPVAAPDGSLATTGLDALALVLVGAGAIGLGAVVARARRACAHPAPSGLDASAGGHERARGARS